MDPDMVQDLIGVLGAPGAIAALLIAVNQGMQLRRRLNGGDGGHRFADGQFQTRVVTLIENGQKQQDRMADLLDRMEKVMINLVTAVGMVSSGVREHDARVGDALNQTDAIYRVVVKGERRRRS